jgi:hypothetical protein
MEGESRDLFEMNISAFTVEATNTTKISLTIDVTRPRFEMDIFLNGTLVC